jgi:hypothetical protein
MQLSLRYFLRLAVIVAGVNGLLASLDARAVEVSPDGYGQVLLYPYYTVRGGANGFNTLISIGNSTPDVKAVRLRFHEAREGAPVADFNIYLDAYAIWTGAVFATVDGAGLATANLLCTSPAVSHDATQPTPFNNVSYRDGPGDVSLDRVREGYFEVIEIGDYGSPDSLAPGYIALTAHHTPGSPPDCRKIPLDNGSQAVAPSGGLFGSALLISTLQGIDYQYAATALTHFTSAKPTAADYGTLSTSVPSLADADPATSVVVDDGGRTIQSQWSRGIDAVSAVLMEQRLQGEFVLDQGTRSATSWIVTMPTKWFYVHDAFAPQAPFTASYNSEGACETVPDLSYSGILYGRESGNNGAPIENIGVPQGWTLGRLCFASQSINFNGTGVFTTNAPYSVIPVGVQPTAFGVNNVRIQDGWLALLLDPLNATQDFLAAASRHSMISGATQIFAADGSLSSRPSSTYYGLAALGFSISAYFNGAQTDASGQIVQSSYISGTMLHGSKAVQ